MKRRAIILPLVALAVLSGCGRGAVGGNDAADNASPGTNGTVPSQGPAAGGVDRAFLVGTWGVEGCAQLVTFHADGSMTASGENDPLRWTLTGDRLTTVENDDPPEPATVARRGDALEITTADGLARRLTRCPAAAA